MASNIRNTKHYAQASAEYQPVYDSQATALKNQLASNLQATEAQRTGINSNYDTMANKQNLQNTVNKNNISNNALGRGLSRSSIVTSGLAQSDTANTRQLGYVEKERAGALGNLDEQKRVLSENYNNSLASLQSNRENQILSLARQLEDTAWGRDYQMKQYNLQVRAQAAQEKYQQAQIAMQRASNATQASYYQRQMALAEREFEASQQDKMSLDSQINYLAQLQEISASDKLTDQQKREWYKLYETNTNGVVNSSANSLWSRNIEAEAGKMRREQEKAASEKQKKDEKKKLADVIKSYRPENSSYSEYDMFNDAYGIKNPQYGR